MSDNVRNSQYYYANPSQGQLDYGDLPLPVMLSFQIVNNRPANLATNTANPNLVHDIIDQPDDAVIIINYDTGSDIGGDVFDAIRGTDKTIILQGNGIEWVFDGNDIMAPKNIDTDVIINHIDQFHGINANLIADIVHDVPTIVLSFAENGVLPGKALIRIKADYTFRSYVGSENLYVYYFDRTENKLVQVAADLKVSGVDSYIEFEIFHNSDFVITKGEIDTANLPGIHTITLNANGGTVTPLTLQTGADGKLTSLPTPVLSDYTFNGWYTAASGGAQITTNTVFSANATIYAQWTSSGNNGNNNAGTGNANGGNSTPASPTFSFSNNTSEFVQGSIVPLVLIIQKDFSLFHDARMNGNNMTRNTDYTAENGSTIITLNADYLNELSVGQHTLEARFTDGAVVTARFTVSSDEDETTAVRPWGNPFHDVRENDWFFESVKYAHQKDLINGTSATAFSPHVPMTRGMLVTILWRYHGQPQAGNAVFTDVADGSWYANAINWADANGIVTGYGNGFFGPNDEITREQMAVMLYNYSKFIKAELPNGRVGAFVDTEQISTWAKEAVDAMYAAEILNGKGNNDFDPLGRATRAEVVSMMRNFIEIVEN